uniref:Uncharacterized protein n=1 Tax=Poecilia latipinna TaxID=48699 RepID=A0A3B3V3M4_9TELE
ISPISKAAAILFSGFSAASFSFLALNRGLYSKTGSRLTNDGSAAWSSLDAFFVSESFLLELIWCIIFSLVENIWKRSASHIFSALGPSLFCITSWFISWSAGGMSIMLSVIPSLPIGVTKGLSTGSGNLGSSGSTTMCFLSLVHPLSFPLRPFSFWVGFCSVDELDVPSTSDFFSVAEDAVDVVDFVKDSTAGVSLGIIVSFSSSFVGTCGWFELIVAPSVAWVFISVVGLLGKIFAFKKFDGISVLCGCIILVLVFGEDTMQISYCPGQTDTVTGS